MARPTRSPYHGTFKKLVLALDVGTTFSGVSYRSVFDIGLRTTPTDTPHSILDPGHVPEIEDVTRFPGQEQVGGDSKIPTIIYYDQHGNIRAVGAEALKDIESMIVERGWTKAEWFKLHLGPSSESNVTQQIPPLPKNKTVLDVFSDFLAYLYKCARGYIEESHVNGARLWASFENHIEFVLPHPNGWKGAQQAQMRKAAIRAGLIPDTLEGHSRVHFVTEGEASLHFCVQSGLTIEALAASIYALSQMNYGEGILVVDAGSGTIDITAYGHDKSAATPAGLTFQEIAPPQRFLRDSAFADNVDHITRCFDKTIKLRFRNMKDPQYIKFGSARDKDLSLGIRSGQLKLDGADVAAFFEPSISCILDGIAYQRKSSSKSINTVFLVGGFAANDWLFSELKDSLEPMGVNLSRPDVNV
ncbi:hypothetical protein C0995_009757 [Termitomyces sp. Mi166|nr:hypothetical protein C0995_009757 [Termitomyces sp. Mi166\